MAIMLTESTPVAWGQATSSTAPETTRMCPGRYANTLQALSPAVVVHETQPGNSFVYCIRNTATYEQLYYGRDGKVRSRFIKATAHGTGFAYKWTGKETLLLTNAHVATWPEVTDEDNPVSGVPPGARKVNEVLAVVRNDEDVYEPGFIPLTRVVLDRSMDAAVLKTGKHINVMPYAVGSSAEVRTGNAVEVRGYPLGAFAAVNVGKVTNPYVEDLDDKWNHVDIAFDALVNRGNSGSPLLAVNCDTGEYELIGLFHAGYREGEAMNLAVAIDGLKPLMEKLVPVPHATVEAIAVPEAARSALASTLALEPHGQLMRFGSRMVGVNLQQDTWFTFRIYGERFPLDDQVYVELTEPVEANMDPPGLLVRRPLEPAYTIPPDMLDSDARERLERLTASLLSRLARVQQYREIAGTPPRTLTAFQRSEKLAQELAKRNKEHDDLLSMLQNTLDRCLVELRAQPPPPPPPLAVPDQPPPPAPAGTLPVPQQAGAMHVPSQP